MRLGSLILCTFLVPSSSVLSKSIQNRREYVARRVLSHEHVQVPVYRQHVEVVLPLSLRGEIVEGALLAFRDEAAILLPGEQGDRCVRAWCVNAEGGGKLGASTCCD